MRKAPPKPVNTVEKPERPSKGDKKPFNKQAGNEKKLVERRIIPQEIYEGKGGPSKRKMMERKRKKILILKRRSGNDFSRKGCSSKT